MAVTTLLNNAATNGEGLALDVRGLSGAAFLISGTFDANVKFEASFDNSTWFPYVGYIQGISVPQGMVSGSKDKASNVVVTFDTIGIGYIRPVVVNYISGSITVVGYATFNNVAFNGTAVKSAGKKTDAGVTDKTISVAGGFNIISITNDGPAELRVCVDADSTILTNNIIYIKQGECFESDISGSVLHYSVASDTCAFRYLLR